MHVLIFDLKRMLCFLAAGGFRAVEGLSVRIKDLDIESSPVKVFVRGEYTKTKTDRVVFLTDEVAQQLKSWLDYKYRTRRVCYKDEQKETGGGKTITEYRTPQKDDNDLIFAVQQSKIKPYPNSLYTNLVRSFAKTLDRMGKGAKEDGNPNNADKLLFIPLDDL